MRSLKTNAVMTSTPVRSFREEEEQRTGTDAEGADERDGVGLTPIRISRLAIGEMTLGRSAEWFEHGDGQATGRDRR